MPTGKATPTPRGEEAAAATAVGPSRAPAGAALGQLFLLVCAGLLLFLPACGAGQENPGGSSLGGTHAGARAKVAGGQSSETGNHNSHRKTIAEEPSKLHVRRTQSRYDVSGTTAAEIARSIHESGPIIDGKPYGGKTEWEGQWQIEYSRPVDEEGRAVQEGRCRISRVDVFIDLDVTLPRWESRGEAPRRLREKWDSFIEALRVHEYWHQQSILEGGEKIRNKLDGMAAGDCKSLKTRAEARAAEVIESVRKKNEQYDRETRHGATQGARWEVSSGPGARASERRAKRKKPSREEKRPDPLLERKRERGESEPKWGRPAPEGGQQEGDW